MATSGTVGLTQVDVTTLIEHAFRRCGKLSSTISGEQQQSARRNLFFLLTDLANRGLSLFCVQKTVLNVVANSSVYNLPVGTIDLLNALYRTQTNLNGSLISGAAYKGFVFDTAQIVTNASVQFASAQVSVPLVVEYSLDSSTWVQVDSFYSSQSVAAGGWVCQDVQNPVSAQYWRVRDTTGTIPTLTDLRFSNSPYEVPMAKLNRDDYVDLPNKQFTVPQGTKSLQYWFDKQVNPRIWIWPISGGNVDQIVVWTQSQIQDVGTLTNSISVPQRWYDSVIWTLATYCATELPSGELAPGRLEYLDAKAEQHLLLAEDAENDGAPMKLQPQIRGYTR